MSVQGIIPVDVTKAFSTVRIALGATAYILTMRYNSRMDRWIMDISDANTNLLLAGLPILEETPTNLRFSGVIEGLPKGAIMAIDLTGQKRDPTELSLGADIPIFYIEP